MMPKPFIGMDGVYGGTISITMVMAIQMTPTALRYASQGAGVFAAMKALIATAAIGLFSFVSAAHGEPAGCAVSMRKAMIAGGFNGVIFCSKRDVTFTLAGTTSGDKYSIYNYIYIFLPHLGGVMHGGERLIVFKGHKYIGQYTLESPPNRITVRGTKVVVTNKDSGVKDVLDFSNGPPKRTLLNEEREIFSR